MPYSYQYKEATISRKIGWSADYYARGDFLSSVSQVSDKTVGQYTEFPDGSKFRRATYYNRSKYWMEPIKGESQSGHHPYYGDGYVYATPTTYRGDEVFSGNWVYEIFAPYCSNTFSGPVASQSQLNEAGTKARLDIADQKAGIGEDLATFRQTLKLIGNPLSTLVSGIKKVHSDKSLRPFLEKSAKDIYSGKVFASPLRSIYQGTAFDKAAKKYLEYVYGWKPLMQDIHDTMKFLSDTSVKPLLLHGTGTSKRTDQLSPRSVYDISHSTLNTVEERNVRSKVSCSIWAQVDPEQAGLRTLNQLGLLNPAALAWELVPWSFVVDWVLPIGSVLNALAAPVGLRFVDGSMSCRVSANALIKTESYYLEENGFTVDRKDSGLAKILYEGYRRDALATWPDVGLWFDSDPFRFDRSLKALALAIVALPSLRFNR